MQKDIHILVVDDEEIMRSLLTDILQDRGYKITAVSDGKQAQDRARDIFFQAAFIDIHMPIMNGVQTLRAVKDVSPKTKIIMMDSFPDLLLEEAQREGAIICINKPFAVKEVIDTVEKVIVRKKEAG